MLGIRLLAGGAALAAGAVWIRRARWPALDGPEAGTRLTPLPAYQEFWHSWQTFRPATTARKR